MEFSGLKWQVKDQRSRRVGPGENYFDPKNVWLADNGLNLKISNGRCASLKTKDTLGYGTYRFYVDARFDKFPLGVTLGLFTYKPDENNSKEIDIELRQWKGNGVFAVHPKDFDYFSVKLNGSYTLHQFTWLPHEISFKSFHGHNRKYLIRSWKRNERIPAFSGENVHINLWLKKGFQAEAHAVIKKFEFVPL